MFLWVSVYILDIFPGCRLTSVVPPEHLTSQTNSLPFSRRFSSILLLKALQANTNTISLCWYWRCERNRKLPLQTCKFCPRSAVRGTNSVQKCKITPEYCDGTVRNPKSSKFYVRDGRMVWFCKLCGYTRIYLNKWRPAISNLLIGRVKEILIFTILDENVSSLTVISQAI